MPARNTERHVGQAVASVLRQSFPDFELVVIDDGSTDGTAQVVSDLSDSRIRLIRNPANLGISACHNLALHSSDSELVVHVDADDVVLPDGFRWMVDAMDGHRDAPGGHCHFAFIDDQGRALSNRFTRGRIATQRERSLRRDYRRDLIVYGGECANHLRTYRRDVLIELGGFDESLRYGEDCDMALRLVDRAPLVLVPEVLYLKRVHRGATTESLSLQSLRFFWNRTHIAWRLRRSGRIQFPKRAPYYLPWLVTIGLLETMRQMAANLMRGPSEPPTEAGPWL
jgi:glycosyltransferase involved in cell wall biosynthesis